MDNKYLNIYNDFVEKIERKELKANEKLPSENELVLLYNTSRETVRKALILLSQNGYIQKIRGKGSFVLEMKKFNFPVSGLISFKELLEKMGKESRTIVEKLELTAPDDFIVTHLNMTPEDKVWEVIRVREIDKEKIILDKDFFNKAYVPHLTKEICEDSIYQYIEQELGIEIGYAKKVISVQEVTAEDKKLMDLGDYNMVVVVENYVYLDDTNLFQYTQSRHRPDKFEFVDFARRNKHT